MATSIKRETPGDTPEEALEEALERVRAGWQDRGYFNVQVSGEAKTLKKNAADLHVALFVQENLQYRLNQITFKHSKNVDREFLRGLFPIKRGDIFSRSRIATGLENLRKAYGEIGHVNYTGVPNTEVNDEQRTISLDVDLDSGKQFHISSIDVQGLDEPSRQKLLMDLPIKPGQIYNRRLWELSRLKHSSMLPNCECLSDPPLQLDEQAGTVALTLDFRPCSR